MKVPASSLYRDPFPPSPHSLSGAWIMDTCVLYFEVSVTNAARSTGAYAFQVCVHPSIHSIDMALNVGRTDRTALPPSDATT